jgi:hypothetical protein
MMRRAINVDRQRSLGMHGARMQHDIADQRYQNKGKKQSRNVFAHTHRDGGGPGIGTRISSDACLSSTAPKLKAEPAQSAGGHRYLRSDGVLGGAARHSRGSDGGVADGMNSDRGPNAAGFYSLRPGRPASVPATPIARRPFTAGSRMPLLRSAGPVQVLRWRALELLG